jgi:hypothetical protein
MPELKFGIGPFGDEVWYPVDGTVLDGEKLDASPPALEVPLEIPGVALVDGFMTPLFLSLEATAVGVASVLAALLLNGLQFHGQYALLVQLSLLLDDAQPVKPTDATNNAAKRARLKLMTHTSLCSWKVWLLARVRRQSQRHICGRNFFADPSVKFRDRPSIDLIGREVVKMQTIHQLFLVVATAGRRVCPFALTSVTEDYRSQRNWVNVSDVLAS